MRLLYAGVGRRAANDTDDGTIMGSCSRTLWQRESNREPDYLQPLYLLTIVSSTGSGMQMVLFREDPVVHAPLTPSLRVSLIDVKDFTPELIDSRLHLICRTRLRVSVLDTECCDKASSSDNLGRGRGSVVCAEYPG